MFNYDKWLQSNNDYLDFSDGPLPKPVPSFEDEEPVTEKGVKSDATSEKYS